MYIRTTAVCCLMKTAVADSPAGFNVQLRCTLMQVKAALSFARFVFAVAYCLLTRIIGTYSLGVRTGRHTCKLWTKNVLVGFSATCITLLLFD